MPVGERSYLSGERSYLSGERPYPPGELSYLSGERPYPPGELSYLSGERPYPPGELSYLSGERPYPPGELSYLSGERLPEEAADAGLHPEDGVAGGCAQVQDAVVEPRVLVHADLNTLRVLSAHSQAKVQRGLTPRRRLGLIRSIVTARQSGRVYRCKLFTGLKAAQILAWTVCFTIKGTVPARKRPFNPLKTNIRYAS